MSQAILTKDNINIVVKDDERVDDLQVNALNLIQNKEQFCFGTDAVLLANFVPHASARRKVACDLGSGNGIIAVLLASKKNYKVTAIEVQKSVAELCEKNMVLNALTDKVSVVNIDMQSYCTQSNKGKFDVVVCNPPYEKKGTGQQSENEFVRIARSEECVTLDEVVKSASHLAKFGGDFYMVHKIERLAEAITLCKNATLEPKVLQILRPSENKNPHLFILKCTSGAKEGLQVLSECSVKDTCV